MPAKTAPDDLSLADLQAEADALRTRINRFRESLGRFFVNKQDIIDLEGINAKVPVATDNIATVAAKHGVYNRSANTMNMTDDVTVTTTDGVVATFKSVFLEMGKGSMKTNDPVDVSRGGSRITAGSMSVEDNGKVVVFENNVRVNIDPATMKAAEAKSGESNASQ